MKNKSFPKQKPNSLRNKHLHFREKEKVFRNIKPHNQERLRFPTTSQPQERADIVCPNNACPIKYSLDYPTNAYRAFIIFSMSSTASSTALSTPICSSMVRQACNTVEWSLEPIHCPMRANERLGKCLWVRYMAT